MVIIRFLSGFSKVALSRCFCLSRIVPFLFAFERTFEYGRKGMSRACADDLVFALSRCSHIKLLFPIFEQTENLVGLG